MSGFEKHGIDHLSASSINLWTNSPDVWVMQYLFGKRTPMGPAPWRGICVEDAVVHTLMGGSEAEAIQMAHDKFDKRFLIGDEATSKERAMIEPMVQQSVEELMEFGKPEFADQENKQEKISITAKGDGWSIPVIGFLDLHFPERGLIVDLKTTNRIPSKMSDAHILQRCIYQKAMGNAAVKFLYVSSKKASWLEDGDVNVVLAEAKNQISRMEAFLRHCDKEVAKAIIPTNKASFFWRGAEDLWEQFYGN